MNLGDPAARKWLTDYIGQFIGEQGVDLYRQDFNVDPLGAWQINDGPDRQGMTENLYVQGYLAYWDGLLEPFTPRRHADRFMRSPAERRIDTGNAAQGDPTAAAAIIRPRNLPF